MLARATCDLMTSCFPTKVKRETETPRPKKKNKETSQSNEEIGRAASLQNIHGIHGGMVRGKILRLHSRGDYTKITQQIEDQCSKRKR